MAKRRVRPKNFALFGGAGYISPRHMRAIQETGNRLVAVIDPNDSVGVLDSYAYDIEYFSSVNDFVEWNKQNKNRLNFASICSPNHLHTPHATIAMLAGMNVICEKPLVVDPLDLDALRITEQETDKKVWVVLQLRYHPVVKALKRRLRGHRDKLDVSLRYITPRGLWYHRSWKGDEKRSGGLITNIGIHFFDMLIWVFGKVESYKLEEKSDSHVAGVLELERAKVDWSLSIDASDLPEGVTEPLRSLKIDEEYLEFSKGFTGLHTIVYENILAGKGYDITDAEPSLRLVADMRKTS